jgi:serine protease Do
MKSITAIMTTDEEVDAELLGGDEYLDLAVLRIDKKYAKLVATIGSSEDMNLGDTVFTVGSPLGYNYRGSVTSGVLSGKDRMVSVSVSSSSSNDWVMRVLQIDASINPGNSGGPLLNVNGEVIGICSVKLVDDSIEGMGFAIPIEYAMNHVDALEAGKKIKWPVLGISMVDLTDTANLNKYNISVPKKITEGVAIVGIKEGTAAASSDLKVGDIVTKIAGNTVKDKSYLRYELYQHQLGDTIEVTYIRNNKEKTTKIKLTSSE